MGFFDTLRRVLTGEHRIADLPPDPAMAPGDEKPRTEIRLSSVGVT